MRRRGAWALAALLVSASLGPGHADAKRIFVPKQHRRIQSAVDAAAAGDTIWVGPGTYYGPIVIKKRLVLFGDEGPEKTVLDGHDSVRVVHVEGTSGVSILGFRIQNGKAPGGSGIYGLNDTLLTIGSCDIRGNWETGVALWKCFNAQIGDCEIVGNHTSGMTASESRFMLLRTNVRDNHAATGGGLNLVASDLYVAKDCLFESNRADDGTGGGLFAEGSSVRYLNCTFRENSAASGGGATAVMDSSDLRIRQTTFERNHSSSGGAVLTDHSYADVQASIFDRNRATAAGAALQILGRRTPGVNPVVIANTFYRNGVVADEGGGSIFVDGVSPEITHNIFVIDSTAKNKAVLEMKSSPRYECNLIQALDGAPIRPTAATLVGNPAFCDAEHGDFHVRDLSPALLAPCGKIGALGKGCGFRVVPSQ
ncbi:MAG TPA: right-handed parallel beta-helix repeat-containing protein [Candidatus Angelobacter sp.]|nr:right-handed parallel beta-helix repeat-containing protein [Candidatus Angelobacter sp.]